VPKNLVITGASGFIGKNIRDFFSKDGSFVVWSVSRFDDHSSIRNIIENNNLKEVCVVLNGWGGVHSSSKNDSELQSRSLEEFMEQVSESVSCKPDVIIGFGSQAEYSELGDTSDIQSISYASAKRAARSFLLEESNNAGVRSHWLRLFSIYGPGMDGRWTLPSLIRHAESGQQLQLGACKQLWGFLHVMDLCRALKLIVTNSQSIGFDVDVGFPAQKPLRETLTDVENILQKQVLKFSTLNDNQADSVPDLSTLHQLGWQPQVSLECGVKELIQHYAKS